MQRDKVNTLLIILTLSIFTSCQKANISKSGYFSKKSSGRTIASVNPTSINSIDPKQVLIFCMATKADEKKCFNKNVKEKATVSFFSVKKEVNLMIDDYILSIDKTINKKFNRRVNFCNKNSLYNFKKCLSLSKDKNTMEILNLKHKEAKFNAQEYLYLKKKIAMVLDKKISDYKLAGLTK